MVPNSTSAQGSPGLPWLPSKGQGPQHPHSTGTQPSCFWIPPGCSAQLQTAPKAVGSAQGQALLRAGWLCTLPAAPCTPQRAGTSQEGAPWVREHTWQQRQGHSNLPRPRTAATLPTHPLWPLTSARPRGGKGRKGALGKCFPSVGKCCQCFVRDCHSKIPPTRNSPMVAASPGDALPHNQTRIFSSQVRTRRADRWVWMQNQVKRIDFPLGVIYKEQRVIN